MNKIFLGSGSILVSLDEHIPTFAGTDLSNSNDPQRLKLEGHDEGDNINPTLSRELVWIGGSILPQASYL